MPRTTKHLKPHQFKKGSCPNPKGRTPNPAIKALRSLTVEVYREIVELILTGNVEDLKKLAQDPNSTALQVGVASAFMKAIKNGDYHVIERIAERIIGKIPDEVKHTGNVTASINMIDRSLLKKTLDELESDV